MIVVGVRSGPAPTISVHDGRRDSAAAVFILSAILGFDAFCNFVEHMLGSAGPAALPPTAIAATTIITPLLHRPPSRLAGRVMRARPSMRRCGRRWAGSWAGFPMRAQRAGPRPADTSLLLPGPASRSDHGTAVARVLLICLARVARTAIRRPPRPGPRRARGAGHVAPRRRSRRYPMRPCSCPSCPRTRVRRGSPRWPARWGEAPGRAVEIPIRLLGFFLLAWSAACWCVSLIVVCAFSRSCWPWRLHTCVGEGWPNATGPRP